MIARQSGRRDVRKNLGRKVRKDVRRDARKKFGRDARKNSENMSEDILERTSARMPEDVP